MQSYMVQSYIKAGWPSIEAGGLSLIRQSGGSRHFYFPFSICHFSFVIEENQSMVYQMKNENKK
jgi:hypothetical protein